MTCVGTDGVGVEMEGKLELEMEKDGNEEDE